MKEDKFFKDALKLRAELQKKIEVLDNTIAVFQKNQEVPLHNVKSPKKAKNASYGSVSKKVTDAIFKMRGDFGVRDVFNSLNKEIPVPRISNVLRRLQDKQKIKLSYRGKNRWDPHKYALLSK